MDGKEISADQFLFRSFVYRKLADLPAAWGQCNGYAIVTKISDAKTELGYVHNMALCDISHLQRIGFKGPNAIEWLTQHNINVPTQINTATSFNNGCLSARLGLNDILILDSIKNTTNITQKLEQKWLSEYASSENPGGFILPRQDSHACFAVCGIKSADMFTKLCAIDLRTHKFANHAIAQTSLAKSSAIIIRHDIHNTNTFFVLVENVLAEYCWDCLYDAMQEYQGQIIGTSIISKLA